ncbi:RNA-binding protein [Mucilaginibacter corticis]|uniref:RNA-binding protein n=1 Tax=Mucilaginibacter corticis TaxID=2597670 RepID=A0A556MMB9_9SPHI|nr:RNA-binding protein [Mucilaginibacter corticis]TSJ41084.1 RNA-binding protein [Mucilaginibacter corticis]
MAKLFIVGLPKDMEEIALIEMFSLHGTVDTVTIVRDSMSRDSKGYGFVTLLDNAGADRAIAALNGAKIANRTLSVRYAETHSAVQKISPDRLKPKRPRRA